MRMSWGNAVDEAADPTTAPSRLAQLAYSMDEGERSAARANPNLPTDTLLSCLESASPDAWLNPALPFLVFSGRVPDTMVKGALLLGRPCVANPATCQHPAAIEQNLTMVLDLWWSTTTDTRAMFSLVVAEARAAGDEAQREVIRFVVAPYRERLERRILPQARCSIAALWMLDRWLEGSAVSPDERSKQADGVNAELTKERAHFQVMAQPKRETMEILVGYAAAVLVAKSLRCFTAIEDDAAAREVVASLGHFLSGEHALSSGPILSPNQIFSGSEDRVKELAMSVRQRWPSFAWSWNELERSRR